MRLLRRRTRPAPGRRRGLPRRSSAATVVAALLVVGGAGVVGVALASQRHAPSPAASAAGDQATPRTTEPDRTPTTAPAAPPPPARQLPRSVPVSISIPAIAVHSRLLHLGVTAGGQVQVPPLGDTPATNEAAWWKYSPTPGQLGASIIEGHIDSAYQGPSVFFRLGALRPGDAVYVTLGDGTVAVFRVLGVRQYEKTGFPNSLLYGDPGYAALRLVTCGGKFDYTTHGYLSNIVVTARLVSSHHRH